MNMIVETKNVTKTFGMNGIAVEAVRGIDLQVREGEFVAIVGPSGSGKSSLLHLIGAMDHPTSGEVFFRERPLSRMNDGARTDLRAREIGFIFQTFNLLPMLNVFENVEVVMRFGGLAKRERIQRTESLLKTVGLAERMRHLPNRLSGGERQRVAVARALANQPALVLADEPTGNLDSTTGTGILELLREICNSRKQTVIMVTHDFRAASYADRVLVLRDGRIRGEAGLKGVTDTHKTLNQLLELELE
ncbi:MAG: ABC transporter ATP-binding protein [Anaerolineales bacterium]|nr:ABC transporter ATP-binding protein [Anaerolineales bacterium]